MLPWNSRRWTACTTTEEFGQIEHGNYPACLEVIIEHENDGDVRQEIWKLLSFRSPLKVLIFYDWDEHEKRTGRQSTDDSRRSWLHDQIEAFFRMGRAFDIRWPEADDTEYLFLVGNRDMHEIIQWRRLTARSGEFQHRCKLPPLECVKSLYESPSGSVAGPVSAITTGRKPWIRRAPSAGLLRCTG